MNIFVPNVAMIFVFIFASHFEMNFIKRYIVLYLMFYYLYRLILICFILRRKELYSVRYELPIAIVGIGLGEVINHHFLATEEILFITPSELREELWFAVILIMYEFCKKIMDTKFKQDNVLSVKQLDKYIINKFKTFYDKYNNCFEITAENNYMCIFVYAIMIFEDFNRGPEKRFAERIKYRVTGQGTLGIMQVNADGVISDEESVKRAYNIISDFWGEEKNHPLGFNEATNYAMQYNPDENYASSVEFIYGTLEHFILENGEWRNKFVIETAQEVVENECDVEAEITEFVCHSMAEFASILKSNCRIEFDFANSNVLDGIYETEHIRVEGMPGNWQLELADLSNVEIIGNGTSLTSDMAGADVLTLRNCYNVKLSNMRLGHNVKTGMCDGVVVRLIDSFGVKLEDMNLYGCGTYGVYAKGGGLTITNCDIHDCSIGAIKLDECFCEISDSKIHNCLQADNHIIGSNSGLTLRNIEIYNNKTEYAIIDGLKYCTYFENVFIHDNKYRKNPLVLMKQDGVTWKGNEQLSWE